MDGASLFSASVLFSNAQARSSVLYALPRHLFRLSFLYRFHKHAFYYPLLEKKIVKKDSDDSATIHVAHKID